MKDELRALPIFGWAFQGLMYVFLKRGQRGQDIEWIRRAMSYLERNGTAASLLIFPEGTDLSPRTLPASRDFARQNGLAVYRQVLHPRTAGFVEIMKAMRSQIDAVYDITMGHVSFAKDEKPQELSLLLGRFHPSTHMLVQRFDIKSMPTGDEELAQWCKDRKWMKKLI